VVVVGAGPLGVFVALGLAALGVGELYVIDNDPVGKSGGLYHLSDTTPQTGKASALATLLTLINPQIKAVGIRTGLFYDANALFIPPCNVVIETTQTPWSQHVALRYGAKKGTPVIIAAAGDTQARYHLFVPGAERAEEVDEFQMPEPQGNLASQIAGALIQDEVRRLLLPLAENDVPATGSVQYDLTVPARFSSGNAKDGSRSSVNQAQSGARFDFGGNYHALVVGAGALGTYVSLSLALHHIGRLTIVDPDLVEDTNLNRQILFYNAVGQPKARVLAKRLRKLCPDLQATGKIMRVDREHFAAGDFDVIFSCVDNFSTRATLNQIAGERNIPLINGGAAPFNGTVEVYCPGHAACLDCYFGVEALAAEEDGRRARCGEAPEPSIVTTNQLIGGLMVGEAGPVLAPETWGPSLRGVLEYDAFTAPKAGVRSFRVPCNCHERSRAHGENVE
jgi:molybdopterin/thiamine biosynthesis adenylyltransferase